MKTTTAKLFNATTAPYLPAPGENATLTFQVKAQHSTMGTVQLCYQSQAEANMAAFHINAFGVCPPRLPATLAEIRTAAAKSMADFATVSVVIQAAFGVVTVFKNGVIKMGIRPVE